MKSICIKINNHHILNQIENELDLSDNENISFVRSKFTNYYNIIVHYTGLDDNQFISTISSILSFIIIDEFEDEFFKNFLKSNYFYFDELECSKILANCYDILIEDFNDLFNTRFNLIYDSLFEYLIDHKNILLNRFY